MNDDFLKVKLRRVIRRYQWLGLWRKLAIWWAIAAALAGGLVFLQHEMGFMSANTLPVFAAVAVAVALGVALHHFRETPDYRWVAKKIEAAHPELNGVLLTAVQQEVSGSPNFFQFRVLQEAIARSQESDWRKVVAPSQLGLAHVLHLAALGCLAFVLLGLRVPTIHGEAPAWVGEDGVAVTPGDTSIERGDSLVVTAQFGGALPPNVTLVVREANTAGRNLPLIKSLADPIYGVSVPEVANDLTYHLEYRGQKTREFKVTVYEHPKLVRSDVDLTFPEYTKLPPKHLEDARRVSAVEGTKLDFALQLNKPVKSAQLIARDGKKTPLPLTVSPDKAVATLANFIPEKTQAYDLQLVDAEGRTNKISAPFSIDVQKNRPPEVRLALPRGDVRPSALEEITFDGTIFDDFGAATYGLAYSVGGGEPKFIELGRDAAGKEKRAFNSLIKLEELGAKPDDLISWYAWAEDTGPDGKVRRTNGDLFFAEVRPFDEVFREAQQAQEEQQQGGGGGGGNQPRRLSELQKQIINATWKLQRDGATPKYAEDAQVVRESQEQALAQATQAAGEARSPADQAAWKEATTQMTKAIEALADAAKAPGPLAQALPAEQAAYQALLKLQARETSVTRRRGGGGGGGGGGNQRQIDQLDLQQSENRYETQRQARSPQNQERREQLAVMNRLEELARRQQDLNERLRELQTALQEARTPQQQEEIRRQLKRLQEEQQQMLADADEVRQRMDRAENQSAMSEQRQQLDQTRENLQDAAEAAAQGSVAQALAAGTRAQRQLQETSDEMRKQNSSEFAEDMREIRHDANELVRQQQEIGEKLDQLANQPNQRRSLTDTGERKELMDQLQQQRERMERIVDRATQISEQAENTEPLLSRHLYDSLRTASQDDANNVKQATEDLVASGNLSYDLRNRLQRTTDREGTGKAFDVTRDMVEENALSAAGRASRRAQAEAEALRKGVERAAETVLGDETEELRMAVNELDRLIDAVERERAQAEGQQPGQQGGRGQGQQGDQRQAGNQAGQNGQQGQEGQQPGDGQQAGQGEQPGQQAGQGQQAGERGGQRQVARNNQSQGRGQGQQPGQEGQQGQGQGQGQQGQNGEQGQAGQQGQQGQGQQGQQGQGQGQQGQAGQQGQGGQGGQGQGGNQQGTAGNENNAGEQQGLADGQQQGRGQRGGPRQLAGGNQRGGNQRGGLGTRPGVDDLLNGFEGGVGGGGWGNLGSRPIGPLTGEEFNQWIEGLRDVEQLVDNPEYRLAVAQAGERARQFRRENRQDELKKPDWTVVKLQILDPLVQVRQRVAEDLARKESKETLAPIDRDPVPNRFAETVRRYYENLGKDQQ